LPDEYISDAQASSAPLGWQESVFPDPYPIPALIHKERKKGESP